MRVSGISIVIVSITVYLMLFVLKQHQHTIQDFLQPYRSDNQHVLNTKDQNIIEDQTSEQKKYYTVIDVVDGDTIKVVIDGKLETLRLIGLDTPETVDPRKTVQCFGKEASAKAVELLLNQKVWLESDTSQGVRDKYNRLLMYVYRDDGLLYNKWMIENGYAHEYTYQQVPYRYHAEFNQAELDAKLGQRGLWSPQTCNGITSSKIINTITVPDSAPSAAYYTSSHSTAQYYYPASCDGWKGLSPLYMQAFSDIESLLRAYPSRTINPYCK